MSVKHCVSSRNQPASRSVAKYTETLWPVANILLTSTFTGVSESCISHSKRGQSLK